MQNSYIILDDDAKSVLKIQSVMDHFSNFTFIAAANSYDEGLNLILKHRPQFVFLEINPHNKSSKLSLLLINELHRYLKIVPKIIAISHDTALAYDALKYDVADFLIKPLSEAELQKTFLRIEKNALLENSSTENSIVSSSKPVVEKADFIYKIGGVNPNILEDAISTAQVSQILIVFNL